MGCVKIGSSSRFDPGVWWQDENANNLPQSPAPESTGNPDPATYTLQRSEQIENFLILGINYPDCKNYEGNKILVFKDVTWKDLAKQKLIDPHFSDNPNKISPIARFEPGPYGWTYAQQFVKAQL